MGERENRSVGLTWQSNQRAQPGAKESCCVRKSAYVWKRVSLLKVVHENDNFSDRCFFFSSSSLGRDMRNS